MKKILFYLFAFLLPLRGIGQLTEKEVITTVRMLFILDASNSMNGKWEGASKMQIAQRLLSSTLDSLNTIPDPHFQIGLRVYGHQYPVPPQNCNDTKLEVAFADNNLAAVKKRLKSIRPLGTSPIGFSIQQAGKDFDAACPTGHCRDIILLITDGIDVCNIDPCKASAALQKRGISLRPFVIGIGSTKGIRDSLSCVGTYFDASDAKTFKRALNIIVEQALDPTTGQINLIGPDGKNSITNLPVLLRNAQSKRLDRSIIHTRNYFNQPDTLSLDPNTAYEGTVYSIPPQPIEWTEIYAGKHNHLASRIEQGTLRISVPGLKTSDKGPLTVVRKKNETEILNVQSANTNVEYINGQYSIDILTLPRQHVDTIIEPDKSVIIAVESPGALTVQLKTPCYGSVFHVEHDEWKWVVHLDDLQTTQKWSLQPGTYKLVYRPRSAQQTAYSKTNTFTVSPGSTTVVRIP